MKNSTALVALTWQMRLGVSEQQRRLALGAALLIGASPLVAATISRDSGPESGFMLSDQGLPETPASPAPAIDIAPAYEAILRSDPAVEPIDVPPAIPSLFYRPPSLDRDATRAAEPPVWALVAIVLTTLSIIGNHRRRRRQYAAALIGGEEVGKEVRSQTTGSSVQPPAISSQPSWCG